jgi:hypothetical protein
MFEKVERGEINTDDFFVLLCITKRIGRSNSAFPSIAKLMQESNFGRDKVYKCLSNLVNQKLITKTQRRVKNKAGKEILSSNLYTITTNLLSVFINAQNQGLENFISEATDFQATDNQAPENQTRSIVHSSLSIDKVVEVKQPAFPKLSTLDKATHKEVFDVVNELFPELNSTPFLRIIVEILIKIPDWHEYALYVQKNKSERYLEVRGWRKWFYEDYLVDKHRPIDTKNTLTPEEEQRMIELGEKYGYDFTEPKEDKNKMTFDDYLLEAKVAKKYNMVGFTPHPSVAHLWDTLEVEEEKQYNFI